VYKNWDYYEQQDIFKNQTMRPGNYINKKSKISSNWNMTEYGDFSQTTKQSLWWASGASAVMTPMFESDFAFLNFYEVMYTGYQNGMWYSYPGYYNTTGTSGIEQYTDPNCTVEGMLQGYDPRCRYWYQEALQNAPGYTILGEPYNSLDSSTFYITISQDDMLSNNTFQSVTGIDLFPKNPYYMHSILDGLKEEEYEKYFLANRG